MKWAFVVGPLTVACILAACVGDEPAAVDSPTDAGGGAESAPPATGTDSGVPATDAGGPATDAGTDTGADSAPKPLVLDPTGDVAPSDFAVAGLGDVTLTGNAFGNIELFVLHSDTGLIEDGSNPSSPTIRAANADPDVQQVIGGIGYRRVAGKIGIFQFKSLVLTGSTINFKGNLAIALVAAATIEIKTQLEVRDCSAGGGLGGNAGGKDYGLGGADGAGPGGGKAANPGTDGNVSQLGGAGGGGYFATGGAGAQGKNFAGAAVAAANGGSAYGSQTLFDPFLGGSGGGGPFGGPGGGAILVTAAGSITIGGDGTKKGGINAGGCTGSGGGGGLDGDKRGGGGSGGTILVEAPVVNAAVNGVLAANGGNGIPSLDDGTSAFQYNGQFSDQPPPTYAPLACTGVNGIGGYGSIVAGGAGGEGGGTGSGTTQCAAANDGNRKWGGSGGGSVGRIRILTSSGTITNKDASFIFSPTTSSGAATLGTIVLD